MRVHEYMEVLRAFFSQPWVGPLVGLVGILAGLLIALFFHRASRVGPRPSYQLKALRLIEKDERALPQEVEILFRGISVPRLTKTHVVFWNSGNATLDGKQIVDADPLRLEFSKDAQVLRARVAKRTRGANEFEVKINDKSPNEVACHFDYLEAGDGAVIEVLHTDEGRYPNVQGTIRGVSRGIANWGYIRTSRGADYMGMHISFRAVMLVGLLAGIALTTLGFLSPLIFKPPVPHEPSTNWPFVGIGLVYVALSLFMLWTARKRFPKSLKIEDIE